MNRSSAVAFVVLCVLAALVTLGVGSALSHPVQTRMGPPPEDLNARAVEFASGSGARIRGWLSLPDVSARGVVILLPGVRANRLTMVGRARFLRAAGYAVLLIDLQGTGESVGSRITFGWRERHDVLAAVEFARHELPHAGVAIIGSSLGGAAALLAVPQLRVEALVIEQVYPTLEEATENRLRMRLGTPGALAAPLLLGQLRYRIGATPDQLRPIDQIAHVGCPLLVIGGGTDRHTTPAQTRALFNAARAPKQLWLIPDAAHVDLHRFSSGEYEGRVIEFLAAHLDSERPRVA